MERRIGESMREAINWVQDKLNATRPVAEGVIISAFHDDQAVWDDGVVLFEADEEIEERKNSYVNGTQKKMAIFKKVRRRQFRNTMRSKVAMEATQKATGTFSGFAEEMLARNDFTLRPLDEDEPQEPGK